MDDYFLILTDCERKVLSEIAHFVFGLGYVAKKDKVKAIGYTFVHKQVKNQIIRFTSAKNRKPILRIKYFAAPAYSIFFQEAIRNTIEEYDYRGTGCYGCGSCDGTHGYRYAYEDGREYYRCGKELIEIMDICKIPTEELFRLIKTQHEFFLQKPVEER